MQSVIFKRKAKPAVKADPAPSRWAWRMQRLMLTPMFRVGLRVGLPFALSFAAGAAYLGDADRRNAIRDSIAEARASFESRPEFMVNAMAIDGAGAQVADDIREILSLDFPVSSFDLNMADLRAQVQELDPVLSAALRIKPGGILEVAVTPRTPVAIWRSPEGLTMVDLTGARVDDLDSRMARPDLPLLAGDGARGDVAEALDLYRASAPLGDRLRGFLRVGERRWTVVLDRDQRILLPETGALQALERVIALQGAEDMLARDVARVDMRLGVRPTVQMNSYASQEWWRVRQPSGQ